MKIRLEQAVFGEKDSGHSLLNHSFESSKIPNQISLKTDLPSGHNSFASYNFYCSAISTAEYYVLIKSLPDSSAQRSGFVYSYSLFIKNSDLEYVNDLYELFNLLPNEIKKDYSAESIEVEVGYGITNNLGDKEKAKKLAYGLLNNKMPIVWLGQQRLIETIAIVWNNLSSRLKSNFQFRVSFGPKDIEQTNEQLVYSPIGLKDKWDNYFVINQQDGFDEEYSEDIKYLTDINSENNSIEKYISDLDIEISSFSDIKKIVLLDKFLADSSFDSLLNSIALLAILLPNKELGKKLKKEIVDNVSLKLKHGDINNILSFRNVEIKHFEEISSIKKEIKNILQNWNFETEAEQLFTSILNSDVQKWWKTIVDNGLKKSFHNWGEKHSKLFWNLTAKNNSNLELIENYIPNDKDDWKKLTRHIPKSISKDQGIELISFSTKRKWYIFHAYILCKLYSLEESIEKQLQIDSSESYFKGLEIIVANFGVEPYLDYSSKNPKTKLTDFSIGLIKLNPSLFSEINVSYPGWITIWSVFVDKKVSPYSYVEKPLKLTYDLLNEYLDGKEISDSLLLEVSKSKYNDLSNFSKRDKLWQSLSNPTKANFVNATSKFTEFQKHLLSNEFTQFEENLDGKRSEEEYVKKLYLNKRDYSNSGLIIDFFEKFNFQEDLFLSFLKERHIYFSIPESERIGYIIKTNKWKEAYSKVKYKYSRNNSNLKIAIEINYNTFSFKSLFSWGSNTDTNTNKMATKTIIEDTPKKILIVVATPLEAKMVLKRMAEKGYNPTIETRDSIVFWHLGVINGSALIMQKTTTMGSSGAGGSTLSISNAINAILPHAVIMLGIAFGLNQDKQKIGTVLVSKQIEGYELSKIKENVVIQRADKIPASKHLVNIFENAGFTFNQFDLNFGLMISGDKLVDNEEFVNRLKKQYPEAIGGEMEGEGLKAACHDKSVDWILMKGICDWGYNKNTPSKDSDQKLAISNVCDFFIHALSNIKL